MEELQLASQELDLRMVRGDYGQDIEGGDHAVEPLRLCLLRFLRGNDFSVTKAFSQVGWFQVPPPTSAGFFFSRIPSTLPPLLYVLILQKWPFSNSKWFVPKIAGAVFKTAKLSKPLRDRPHVCTTNSLGYIGLKVSLRYDILLVFST